jgi:DNA-binding CsgD family transcriptional regulator
MRPVVNEELINFANACEAAITLSELEALWLARMRALGFTYVALGAHVDPLRPGQASYVFQNYPAAWIAHYSDARYHLIDPVFRAVERGRTSFDWTAPEFFDDLAWRQRRVLAEAKEFGLRYGRTHALAYTPNFKASGSFVTETPDIDPEAYAAAKLVNIIVHQRAAQLCAAVTGPIPELRRRERQCLELCASGLNDEEAACALGVSVATVRRHIERARTRMGVSSRMQAVIRAISSGQIRPLG